MEKVAKFCRVDLQIPIRSMTTRDEVSVFFYFSRINLPVKFEMTHWEMSSVCDSQCAVWCVMSSNVDTCTVWPWRSDWTSTATHPPPPTKMGGWWQWKGSRGGQRLLLACLLVQQNRGNRACDPNAWSRFLWRSFPKHWATVDCVWVKTSGRKDKLGIVHVLQRSFCN